jgi:hypothetical protein
MWACIYLYASKNYSSEMNQFYLLEPENYKRNFEVHNRRDIACKIKTLPPYQTTHT